MSAKENPSYLYDLPKNAESKTEKSKTRAMKQNKREKIFKTIYKANCDFQLFEERRMQENLTAFFVKRYNYIMHMAFQSQNKLIQAQKAQKLQKPAQGMNMIYGMSIEELKMKIDSLTEEQKQLRKDIKQAKNQKFIEICLDRFSDIVDELKILNRGLYGSKYGLDLKNEQQKLKGPQS